MFVLGVGAQKAGTTWLHRYVSPGGPMKEFHVWNVLEGPPESHPPGGFRLDDPLRQRMLADPDCYFDHFARGGADITPAYAALPVDTFRRIRDGFEKRGVEVRPVFLMRDPAERLWSAWNMETRLGLTGLAFDDYIVSPGAQVRGRYEQTVRALDTAFDKVWFGFYETMFGDALPAMSAFLGVPYRPELVGTQVGPSTDRAIAAEARQAVQTEYAATYAFCRERFPETASLWNAVSAPA